MQRQADRELDDLEKIGVIRRYCSHNVSYRDMQHDGAMQHSAAHSLATYNPTKKYMAHNLKKTSKVPNLPLPYYYNTFQL